MLGRTEQPLVAAEMRETEIREARLPRPEQMPFAADLEVALRELEAVRRLDHRLETLARGVRQLLLRPRDEQAVRLLRTATHPPAELMQLSETEAVRLLHDHDRRVRNVDADLDHRGCDEDVDPAGLELRHALPALGGLQPDVQTADAKARELPCPQPLGLVLRGTGDRGL